MVQSILLVWSEYEIGVVRNAGIDSIAITS